MGRHVAAAGVMLSHARITRRLAGPAQDMSKLLKVCIYMYICTTVFHLIY